MFGRGADICSGDPPGVEHAAVLQCCRAAGRGVGGPRVCSQLMLRDAARQDPRPPTHPRTAHSRHGDTADTGAVFAHNNSLPLLLSLLLLLLLLVLLSRDYSSRVLWPVSGRRGPAAARRGNYRWYHSWRITIISITSGQDMKGQASLSFNSCGHF